MTKILITLFMTLVTTTAFSSASHHDTNFAKAAEKTKVPMKLLKAICMAESGLNPHAYNPDDPGGGAFGMCQVLGTTATSYMAQDPKCLKVWPRHSKQNVYANCKWFGSYTSMYLAGRVLRWQLNIHKGDWLASVAGYNSGTPKICQGGWVVKVSNGKKLYKPRKWGRSSCWKTQKGVRTFQEGSFLNQGYVNRVMKALSKL